MAVSLYTKKDYRHPDRQRDGENRDRQTGLIIKDSLGYTQDPKSFMGYLQEDGETKRHTEIQHL